MAKIVVFGATGTSGGAAMRHLLAAGFEFRRDCATTSFRQWARETFIPAFR